MSYGVMGRPDYDERKGSLFLRSDHMNYGRVTKNANWHQARESEPKDYDISTSEERDLCKSTYNRIGGLTDGALPRTTYETMSDQLLTKTEFTEQEVSKPMINAETASHANIDRDTGKPRKGSSSILPSHHPEHDKQHTETTHTADYGPPYPFTRAEDKPQEFADNSMAYKKCHSQFSDWDDYRRCGRNTWMDESGIYANTHFRGEVPVYQRRDPLKLAD